jgi:hypothetical protein
LDGDHFEDGIFVRPYLPFDATGNAGQGARHQPALRAQRRHGVDRVKTALLVAAALASILVGLVAAKSLLRENEQQSSPFQATK